jgi:hypothetical protein
MIWMRVRGEFGFGSFFACRPTAPVYDGLSSVCVPERSPVAIADALEGLLTDPDRYCGMSEATADTRSKLVCPVTYFELIRRWAADTSDDDRWLAGYSLASGRYD